MRAFWNHITEHKPLRLVAVFLFATIAVAVFTGVTFATNVITVIDGEKTSEHYTMDDGVTPEEILESEGIELSGWDEFEFTGFGDGRTATLTVLRAFPVILSDRLGRLLGAYAADAQRLFDLVNMPEADVPASVALFPGRSHAFFFFHKKPSFVIWTKDGFLMKRASLISTAR